MKKDMIFALEREMRRAVNFTPEYDYAAFVFETLMAKYGMIKLSNRLGANWYEVRENVTGTVIHILFDKDQCVKSIGYYSKKFQRKKMFIPKSL